MADDTSRISPTAHYTGFVWYRHGLSHPSLATREGRLLFGALRPFTAAYEALGGPSLEQLLLARHLLIDHLLEESIASGAVGQVIEIAAGLSPRGHRFMARHGGRGLRYIEGDLPGMAARKRRILSDTAPPGTSAMHQVVELDALAESGPRSLGGVAAALLDPGVGTAIVTEGLLNYFDRALVVGLWRRIAAVLAGFPQGRYLADLALRDEVQGTWAARAFQAALSAFARGRVHLHFADAAAAARALREAGFSEVTLHRAGDAAAALGASDPVSGNLVRIVDVAP